MSARAMVVFAGTALAVVGSFAPLASAQRVLTNFSAWSLPLPTLEANWNGNTPTHDATGVTGTTTTASGVLYNFRGRSFVNPAGAGGDFSFTSRVPRRSFTVARNADIYVPLLMDFRAILGGNAGNPGGNNSQLLINWRAELWQEATAGTGDWAYSNQFRSASEFFNGPTDAVNPINVQRTRTVMTRFDGVAASPRQYQLRFYLDVSGTTQDDFGNNGVNGSFVEVRADDSNPNTGFSNGLFMSIAATPAGYNGDSRARVKADATRAAFGIDGAGTVASGRARVAILEPGTSFSHGSLAGGRFSLLDNGTATERLDEHALATTSIVAGQDANTGRAGIAPGAQVVSASISDYAGTLATLNAVRTHYGAGTPVAVNYSASDGGMTVQSLDRFINDNQRITFVGAAGNEQESGPDTPNFIGNVEQPNYARNIIAVGALDSAMQRPASFSSESGSVFNALPHIMAPGEYVLSAAARDQDNDGQRTDYTRVFTGGDWKFRGGAVVGAVNGTSFATPHVTGAVALLHDYAAKNDARFDADSTDHRVMKAVLLAGADRWSVRRRDGSAWTQLGNTGAGVAGDPRLIDRSLDSQLGAGVLDTFAATSIFAAGEVRAADDNTARNFQISAPAGRPSGFWDRETVGAKSGGIDGTVDYFLPTTIFAGIGGGGTEQVSMTAGFNWLRACLTWDQVSDGTTYTDLANLELRLYADRIDGNTFLPGFDPNNPNADILLAQTTLDGENVRLMDLGDFQKTLTREGNAADVLGGWSFYLQVRNLSDTATTYGLAVTFIPTPTGAAMLMVAGVVAAGRRRR